VSKGFDRSCVEPLCLLVWLDSACIGTAQQDHWDSLPVGIGPGSGDAGAPPRRSGCREHEH